MRKILFIYVNVLMLFPFSTKTNAQAISDKAINSIKLMLTLEALHTKDMTISSAFDYIEKAEISFDTLQSRGFSNLTFLAVSTNIISDFKTGNPPLFGNNCPYYIIALSKSSELALRIQGFMVNDTEVLFKKFHQKVIPRRKFLRDYYIEGIDLKCLYKAWKANSFDTKKYPCLRYCNEPTSTH